MKKPSFFLWIFLFTVATAQAQTLQTWSVNNEWNFEFLGCSRLSTGFVECVMSAEYVGKDSQRSVYFSNQDTKAVTPDGREALTRTVTALDKDVTGLRSFNIFQNVPFRLTYAIPYPKEFSTIRMLFLNGKRFDYVPVLGSAPTTAPPGAIMKTELYDIQLSGCAASAGGGYTCSGAVVTPKK